MYRILVTTALLILSLVIVDSTSAQPTASPTTAPTPAMSQQQQEMVQKLIRQEIEQSKTIDNLLREEIKRKEDGVLQDLVQGDVNRVFGITTTLINIQLVVVTLIAAVVPVAIAGVFWAYSKNIESRAVDAAKNIAKDMLADEKKQAEQNIKQQVAQAQQTIEDAKSNYLSQLNNQLQGTEKRLDEIKQMQIVIEKELRNLSLKARERIQAVILDIEKEREEASKVLDKSIEALRESLKTNPDSFNALYTLGMVLMGNREYSEALSNFEKALKTLEKILENEPNSLEALTNKGNVLIILGRYPEALEIFGKILEIHQDDASALYKIARVYAAQIDAARAAESLEKAIRIDATYREQAKDDVAFDRIREDERFKQIFDNE